MNHFPTATFMFWTEDNLPHTLDGTVYNQCKSYAQKSDIARYEILYKYGGCYVDCDMECLRRFMLHENYIGWECKSWLGTALISAKKQDVMLERILEQITCGIDYDRPPNETTGPMMVTNTFKVFKPIDWSYITLDEAYTNHHWSHSWK